ncbi:hypothetical protein [Kocuria sp. TGY1127_2]|nr:hypothetical protein [Kocuria sp. TGY1127_2]
MSLPHLRRLMPMFNRGNHSDPRARRGLRLEKVQYLSPRGLIAT